MRQFLVVYDNTFTIQRWSYVVPELIVKLFLSTYASNQNYFRKTGNTLAQNYTA